MRLQAIDAALIALEKNETLIELQFPAVSNMATAALNQLLDANRSFTKQLLFACRPRFPSSDLHAIFQDKGETKLAMKTFGKDMPFSISSLPRDDKSIPAFVQGNGQGNGQGIMVVVQPGFNVDEWISMERLQGPLPIVTVNADLDKVRSNYYPRLFYPGLHAAKNRFLSKFGEVYYLKPFSNGGTLFKRYPDIWRLFYTQRSGETVQVWSGDTRPPFVQVEKQLSQCRQDDLLSS